MLESYRFFTLILGSVCDSHNLRKWKFWSTGKHVTHSIWERQFFASEILIKSGKFIDPLYQFYSQFHILAQNEDDYNHEQVVALSINGMLRIGFGLGLENGAISSVLIIIKIYDENKCDTNEIDLAMNVYVFEWGEMVNGRIDSGNGTVYIGIFYNPNGTHDATAC